MDIRTARRSCDEVVRAQPTPGYTINQKCSTTIRGEGLMNFRRHEGGGRPGEGLRCTFFAKPNGASPPFRINPLRDYLSDDMWLPDNPNLGFATQSTRINTDQFSDGMVWVLNAA